MNIWHSLILGIIEGITEFLPISSTGHLILAGHLLNIPGSAFSKSFNIIIQLGAILAVIILYWKKIWKVEMIKKLIVAFIPTGVIGLAMYKFVKEYLLDNTVVVLWSLLLGGLFLIFFEIWHVDPPEKIEVKDITYKQAFGIGLFQSISIIPGISRSAATIVGGLILGLNRMAIVEFSFLLAIPTMLAATGLDLVKNYSAFSGDQFGVLAVGFVVSFAVALGSIKFLLNYIQKHNFITFGIYRVVIAILFWILVL